jgi:hypothetical protein
LPFLVSHLLEPDVFEDVQPREQLLGEVFQETDAGLEKGIGVRCVNLGVSGQLLDLCYRLAKQTLAKQAGDQCAHRHGLHLQLDTDAWGHEREEGTWRGDRHMPIQSVL